MPSRLFADLSDNNAAFNAHAYASAGHQLVALKASEGVGFTDPKHGPRADQAHHAGLLVAHYHFCRPDTHPDHAGEAETFWAAVKPFEWPGDFLVLDLEVTPRGGMAQAAGYLAGFDAALHRISGHRAVGYTYVSYLDEAGPRLQVASRRWWIAAYGSKPGRLGAGRHRWAWQYTDGRDGPTPHRFAGIGQCDGSRLFLPASRDVAQRIARRRHRHAG